MDTEQSNQRAADVEKAAASSQLTQLATDKAPTTGGHDVDPMANRVEDGVEYQSMTWWQAGMVMVAETISLGILSLPQAMSTVGAVPGLILLLFFGAFASYSGLVIGQFKLQHPHVHSMGCAGQVLFGKWGGIVIGCAQFLFYIFVMGSHILTFAICMNTITGHGACTIVWMMLGTALSLVCTLPRTLKHLSYFSMASFVSIIGAVMVTMVAVGISKPAMQAAKLSGGGGDGALSFRLWPSDDVTFVQGFLAVSNIVFAYAGHPAFFTFISELKNPRDFPKALAFLQISDISMYVIAAIVIYYFAGDSVASPALNSAKPVVAKVAWGVAIPTIIVAGVVNGHVGVKYLYVRCLRDRDDDLMHQKTWRSRAIWIGMATLSWLAAWFIAEVVPVFNDMLGITSALFASWFTFGLSGIFWFSMNFERREIWYHVRSRGSWSWKKTILLLVNLVLIAMACILCVVGLYASISSIKEHGATKKPFSCSA
ncbi:uncharacterized protein A1O9_06054 [Exophiala aquamarina CBS 119918]|uniref:Amino acid transporter transmembrane domain-containing protein n=1 Tax=Exophiala aquamarina CBS 119918 TaxID=1182545 RepID=A0A072PE43_9EURO|nr:uncharacterized protein A1O9_06054 [Exophiala aquamarina CBS 119918]KEF58131.1 hypothetical protein A1O9_06054 [Exophiala aquamarina CBS 119918]